MILQVLITMVAGWINRHQQQVIDYLLEENRTLHAKLGGNAFASPMLNAIVSRLSLFPLVEKVSNL